jgi:peptide/nickel transport system permease protein
VIVCAVGIGCLLGGAAGFFGGWIDGLIMRFTDVTLAFPAILLAMVMTASLGPGLFHAGIAMVVVWWPIYARLMRAQVLSVKQQPHVEAATAVGVGRWRLFRVHIAPLAITPALVNATMDFGQVVLLAAGLSFIGLGANPPSPEWGLMINEGAIHFYQWWVALGPGVAILSVVLAFNFVGDGVRDLLDVRSSTRSSS